ncbi:MAG: ribosome biogenesis GTPase Der [bacterium]|nr:ribosome biogenesis GTPase Der [bacterium]
MNSIPTIAIIGRRNVGKSALFNRFLEEEKAIVSDVLGTTRDRTEGYCWWRGEQIKVVDTGGLDIGEKDFLEKEILAQARYAMENADLILLLVDLKTGLLPQESMIVNKLKPYRKKIILVGNKADGTKIRAAIHDPEWLKFGFGEPMPVSAVTGAGVGDLLDEIFERIKIPHNPPLSKGEVKEDFKAADEKPPFKIAIIGRPNVGKSLLLNSILGEKRVIVSPVPHTTREPQDTEMIFQNQKIILIDTAGIRQKNKIPSTSMEKKGIERSLKVINRADLIFFLLEPMEHFPHQDKDIASALNKTQASLVLVINKWDTAENNKISHDKIAASISYQMPQLAFAPIVFVSALTGLHINKLLPLALKIAEERKKMVSDEELKELLPKLILRHKPSRGKGTNHPIIRAIEQTRANPPQFTVWIGTKQSLHFSYVRFLENRLREHFGFDATPIRIWVRQEKR